MKKIHQLSVAFVVLCLVLLCFQGVVYADSVQQQESLQMQNVRDSVIDAINFFSDEDEYNQPSWYPGFLIVQLVKGIMAFFLIILILFDIIEPN